MIHFVSKPIFHVFLLSLLCWVLFFHHLDRRDLWNSHEGRAAQDAQTLVDRGMTGMPALYDGQTELQKPPIFYWCVASLACLRDGKVDALCVRLPSALAAWGCVLVLYGWGYLRGRPVLGLVAALVLATSMHFTWAARVGRIDMPLTLCTTLGLLCMSSPGKLGRVIGYLLVALAVLFKGPIGLVLPAAVLGSWWLVHRLPIRRPLVSLSACPLVSLSGRGLWWGIPLMLAIVTPYYWWLNHATGGEFFRVFFLYHNVERGFGSDGLREHPLGLYVARMGLDLFPWILLVPLAAWYAWRRGLWQSDPIGSFGAVWFIAMSLALSCARFKRADYLLPAYPGLALFLGSTMQQYLEAARFRRGLSLGLGGIVLCCAAVWLWYIDVTLPAGEATREYRSFAQEVRRIAPAASTVWFFETESHTLAFHLGRPVRTFVQWEDLDELASTGEPAYVVMPAALATNWQAHLHRGMLEEVTSTDRNGVRHEKPLVLMRANAYVRAD